MDKAKTELILTVKSRGVTWRHLRDCNRRNGGDAL
jgi:hypothetical protein